MFLMSSSLLMAEWELDSVGKLNCTDLAGLADGCTVRDLTVSMTWRQRATVLEMPESDWLDA